MAEEMALESIPKDDCGHTATRQMRPSSAYGCVWPKDLFAGCEGTWTSAAVWDLPQQPHSPASQNVLLTLKGRDKQSHQGPQMSQLLVGKHCINNSKQLISCLS